jgi:hypothetical protein
MLLFLVSIKFSPNSPEAPESIQVNLVKIFGNWYTSSRFATEMLIFYPELPPSVLLLLIPSLSLILLYAEIHFRLPFWKGLLFRRQPEIIFDTPYRIQTDFLPVMLFMKDADRYPVRLFEVQLSIFSHRIDHPLKISTFPEDLVIDKKWFTKIYQIEMDDLKGQEIWINCEAKIKIGSHIHLIRNDNYRRTSHAKFKVFIDPDPLPTEKGWLWGDLHYHSLWTENQVEFGGPVEEFNQLARPMGISYCALTDHSFDLDDQNQSWTRQDPALKKWYYSRELVQVLNAKEHDFIFIPGEEISVDNGRGKYVHLCVLNSQQYFKGSADAVENFPVKDETSHYAWILDRLEPSALAFAAHPDHKAPWIHQLLLRRRLWNYLDRHHRLNGFQFINGIAGDDLERGKQNWIRQILRGSRVFAYAGNDAHGNFNRFRQINLPLISIQEHKNQIFGEYLTAVKASITEGVEGLIQAFQSGSVIVSNGPFIDMQLKDSSGIYADIGGLLFSMPLEAGLRIKSSAYFGSIRHIRLFYGDLKQQREYLIFQQEILSGIYQKTIRIPLNNIALLGYLRAEVLTSKSKFALTNPIWYQNRTK